jgi:hypothetical protein
LPQETLGSVHAFIATHQKKKIIIIIILKKNSHTYSNCNWEGKEQYVEWGPSESKLENPDP